MKPPGRWTGLLIALAIAASTISSGRGKSSPAPSRGKKSPGKTASQPAVASQPESSPRAALATFAGAFADLDEDRLPAVVVATEEEKDALRAVIAYGKTSRGFRDAFIAAYGKEAWATFQDPNRGPKDGNTTLNFPSEEDREKIMAQAERATIEQRGDEASAQSPAEPNKMRLVKVQGGWLFAAGSSGQVKNLVEEGRKLRKSAQLIRKYQAAIGRPGIKPEDIDAELGRAILESLSGIAVPAPHRFDIDKL